MSRATDVVLWLGLALFLMLGLALLAGCAPGADGARQAVATANSTIGQGYRAERVYVRVCAKDAVAKASQSALDTCKQNSHVMLQVLDTASDVTDATEESITVAEKAKKKEYTGVVAPLMRAIGDVVAAFGNFGIKLEVK